MPCFLANSSCEYQIAHLLKNSKIIIGYCVLISKYFILCLLVKAAVSQNQSVFDLNLFFLNLCNQFIGFDPHDIHSSFHFLPLFRYSSGIPNIKSGINLWIAGVITACNRGKTK